MARVQPPLRSLCVDGYAVVVLGSDGLRRAGAGSRPPPARCVVGRRRGYGANRYDAAQADLNHVAGRPAAAVNANLAGYEPAGDHSDLIVPLPHWVVVISPNFHIKPRSRWDGYLKRGAGV
jgi:hypothetical protein